MRSHNCRGAGRRAVLVAAVAALAAAPAAVAQDPVSGYTPPPPPPDDYSPPVVKPVAAKSARAAMRGPRQCVRRTVPVTVTGTRMAKVTFTVNGKGRRVVAAKGKSRLRVHLALRGSARAQRVTAVVAFRAQSTPTRRTLRVVAFRCAPARISPTFTG
jgi:hypothetical protein